MRHAQCAAEAIAACESCGRLSWGCGFLHVVTTTQSQYNNLGSKPSKSRADWVARGKQPQVEQAPPSHERVVLAAGCLRTFGSKLQCAW